MRLANILLNLFTSLIFMIMAFNFVAYLIVPTESWMTTGLLTETNSLLGLHKLQWIVIIFLNVFLVGVYAYIWGKKVGIKFLAALFYMIASLAALYLLWPTKKGIDASFLRYGHMVLMGGFIIGAILLTAQSYLKTLNDTAKAREMESGNLTGR